MQGVATNRPPLAFDQTPCDIVDFAMISVDQQAELAIHVQLNKSDISRSTKLRAIRSPLFWVLPLWFGGILYFTLPSREYAWVWATLAGLIMLVFLLYRSGASTAKQPGVLSPITYIFSDYGITAEFENGTNKAMWSLVKGARETEDYFFIEMQRRSFHLIPKRLLIEDQASRLRAILRANVTKSVRLLS